ncbi:hypothetical protein GE09DRAFT_1225121 [Coniochaeta sp. 2T2.1]|nr:hypothetical protein GE09DRAFT_1225121 [Coniochaeta sp. 2T2.1]
MASTTSTESQHEDRLRMVGYTLFHVSRSQAFIGESIRGEFYAIAKSLSKQPIENFFAEATIYRVEGDREIPVDGHRPYKARHPATFDKEDNGFKFVFNGDVDKPRLPEMRIDTAGTYFLKVGFDVLDQEDHSGQDSKVVIGQRQEEVFFAPPGVLGASQAYIRQFVGSEGKHISIKAACRAYLGWQLEAAVISQ